FGAERYEIISMFNSFHGRTLATLTATGQTKFQKGFEPLMPGFKHVPFNDIDALRAAISNKTCAVMLEPIQAEGGVHLPTEDYLAKVRELCIDKKLLLIFDEVQTGMGRTGKLFAYEHYDICPDIMSLAKGLGGGVPIGAMLATDKVAAAFQPRTHASTFGGNPLVCAAAIAAVESILEDGFILDQCNRMSRYLIDRLNDLKGDHEDKIVDVRGKGLLIAMELMRDGVPYVTACMERGVLVGLAGAGNILRFTPPLIVEEKDIDQMIDVLEEVLDRVP
ncbi:MAG TPA: aminotransferase class III-fold pyridoxal phosphate-dependent enzyme, partial [Dissulfurispiraceae bacterium]|nr:aminotransferase class III-fold pyridoxal phosphate-dependent enzyme [Dissulfurispiraceae bacterium]